MTGVAVGMLPKIVLMELLGRVEGLAGTISVSMGFFHLPERSTSALYHFGDLLLFFE